MPSRSDRSRALRFIVSLGIVSLFADMTYEGMRGVAGPLLRELGASAALVGIIAGFGEMIAAALRLVSGKLADRTRAYWGFTIFGYCLNLVAVPLLAFAGNWQVAALLVIAERAGKGLRGPARDVLLSGATAAVGHGWGFGLHTALDQAGAVAGPLLVAWAVAREQHFAPAMLWQGIPAAAAICALRATRALSSRRGGEAQAQEAYQRRLPRAFWMYVGSSALLAGGFVDFALLAFHFQKTGLFSTPAIPLLYAGAMGINGLSAPAWGRLFDRFGARVLAAAAVVSLAALPLGFLGGAAGAMAGIACWAAGMGAQDACLRPGIARAVTVNLRGSAFGIFDGVFGAAWFAGSALMGLLYGASLPAMVAFGVACQLGAALLFFRICL